MLQMILVWFLEFCYPEIAYYISVTEYVKDCVQLAKEHVWRMAALLTNITFARPYAAHCYIVCELMVPLQEGFFF